jgi:hypothetical protein
MNKALIIGGILLLLIFGIGLPRSYSEFTLSKSGEPVKVLVLRLPNCNQGYKHKFITIKYQETNYILRTKCKFTKNLVEKQEIQMFHKPGTSIFIFPEEDVLVDFISNILIGLLGLLLIVKVFLSIRKQRTTLAL